MLLFPFSVLVPLDSGGYLCQGRLTEILNLVSTGSKHNVSNPDPDGSEFFRRS